MVKYSQIQKQSTKKSQSKAQLDKDTPWKEVLHKYFKLFMMFFFPHIYNQIDWSKGYTFLDKEFQQVIKDADTGRKYVDKLVQIYLKDDTQHWLLIHIEVQSQKEINFEERLFTYYYRIFDRYNCKVISLVILADNNQKWRPSRYSYELLGFEVGMKFPTIKLLDYKHKLAELENSDNPFAIVVIAHLKALENKNKPQQLYDWKRDLIYSLYEKGYNKEDLWELVRFIDWVMILSKEMEEKLKNEIIEYERINNMPYVTSIERLGREQGRLEEGTTLILKQLQRRMGILSKELDSAVRALTVEKLELLGEDLLDFQSIKDLTNWLNQH